MPHLFAKIVTACTLLLIAAGGLVTSTGSGLSVPDWPLSYGTLFPPMIGGIRFEHSHRVIAATVGFLTLILCVLFFKDEKRGWVKGLSVVAVVAVLLQAILGGITVKFLLPAPVSVAHACLGQAFFCLIAFLALCASREWLQAPRVSTPYAASFARLTLTTALFIFAQLILGATVRHTRLGVDLHIFTAFFILVHAVFLNLKAFWDRQIGQRFLAQLVLMDVLLAAQLFLGLGSFFYEFVLEKGPVPRLWEVLFTTAHQTVGAVILCNAVLMSARAFRLFDFKKEDAYPSDHLQLMKPRVTLAALFTVLVGYTLAVPSLTLSTRLIHTLLAAFLIGGGSNALNQYYERDTDARMKRTENRPLPSGRLSPANVFWFGLPVAIMGIAELFIFVNLLSGFLGLLTLVVYVYFYTPLKRHTTFNTFVGAVPGALPIALGWTAASGVWGMEPLVLFTILFIWQIPHFFAIAWVYREDYRRGGLRMMPCDDPDGRVTAVRVLLYSSLLLPSTLLPVLIGLSGPVYWIGALLLGAVFMAFAARLYRRRMDGAKTFVAVSIYYLLALMTVLVADKFIGKPSAVRGDAFEQTETLADYGSLPDFMLTRQDGQPFGSRQMKGKLWVADFIFTRCPQQCPMMTAKFAILQKDLPADVRLVSFSVDPANDTPEKFTEYAKPYGAKPDRWAFLAGDAGTLKSVRSAAHLGGENDPSMHSLRFVLLDKELRLRGYYDSTDSGSLDKIKKDVERLRKEK